MDCILQLRDKNGAWISVPAITGEKGDKGDQGSDGVSVTHSWNGTVLSVTSASGTSSADLKGEKGDTGDMAVSVYDPQGKAQDIFAYVDTAIFGAIEGSY